MCPITASIFCSMPSLPRHLREADQGLAFTDGVLVYCPSCIRLLRLLEDGETPPNWLLFFSIDILDELPQKGCDR